MRIALMLLSVFVCCQMIAAGLIKEHPPPPKCHEHHDDGKKDKHTGCKGDWKEPDEKEEGEWKKKESHPSHDHDKGKLPLNVDGVLSGLGHLTEKIPLINTLSGNKGLGSVLDLSNSKNDLININGLKKSLPLIGYLPGKVGGKAIGLKEGKGLLDLKGITGKLPLKGIHGDSDCDDDDEKKKSHGIKRRGLSDDWNSADDDWQEKNGKGDGDWKKDDGDWKKDDDDWKKDDGGWKKDDGGWKKHDNDWKKDDGDWKKDDGGWKKGHGKSEDVHREKNKGKSDAWKANNDKQGYKKGSKSEEHKNKDVQISVNLKDRKDSASWENAWKSKTGKKGKSSSDSWDQNHVTKELPCDEDLDWGIV